MFFLSETFSQSTRGTYVNKINFKGSRSILSNGDKLGFGCTTTNRHLNDVNDEKYHVYRLTNENELGSNDTIDLLDSDDEETPQNAQNGNGISINDEDSEEECPSADEMDIKPDIHSLMRKNQEMIKIKEEINWNCHEYDRQMTQNEPENDAAPVDSVDLDADDDSDTEIYVVEPARKRQRLETSEFDLFNPILPQPSTFENGNVVPEQHNTVEPDREDDLSDRNLNVIPEYQMSDATLKEKVKNVQRSRGQQLAADMLNAQSKNKPKGLATTSATPVSGHKAKTPSSSSMPNNPIASTSKAPTVVPPLEIPSTYRNDNELVCDKSVEDLTKDFISVITKWNFKWIDDRNLNPLQYSMNMNVRHLDTDFTDLHTFQQFVLNFI